MMMMMMMVARNRDGLAAHSVGRELTVKVIFGHYFIYLMTTSSLLSHFLFNHILSSSAVLLIASQSIALIYVVFKFLPYIFLLWFLLFYRVLIILIFGIILLFSIYNYLCFCH